MELDRLLKGVLIGTLIAVCIWVGFTMVTIDKISDDIHTIAAIIDPNTPKFRLSIVDDSEVTFKEPEIESWEDAE